MKYEARLFNECGEFIKKITYTDDNILDYIEYNKSVYIMRYEESWINDVYVCIGNYYLGRGKRSDTSLISY
jgi:hypothetical protein